MSNNKRFILMGDIARHGCKMRVQCRHCPHHSVIGAWTIVMSKTMKASIRIDEAVARMRCTRCGRRRPRWSLVIS